MPMPASLVALPPMPITRWGNPQIQRRHDQFSRAEGGGEHGIEPILGNSAKPLAVAISIAANRRAGIHGGRTWRARIATRAGDGDGARLAIQGIDQHVGQSVTAVGDRNPRDLSVRQARTTPRAMASAAWVAVRQPFEGIGAKYDFHGFHPRWHGISQISQARRIRPQSEVQPPKSLAQAKPISTRLLRLPSLRMRSTLIRPISARLRTWVPPRGCRSIPGILSRAPGRRHAVAARSWS